MTSTATGEVLTSEPAIITLALPTTITIYGVTYRVLEGGETVAVESVDTSLSEVLVLTEVEGKAVASWDEGVLDGTAMLVFQQTDATACTVYAYTGSETSLTVPSSKEGFNVKAVAAQAFLNNTNLTSISLPNSIEVIGSQAFKGCSSLSTMTNHD
ncbi:MAG: leucine-rich repeat protein [Clostridia bacterium]|nr:leucine-rich repeat protein [Clostridia bacterium]